MKLFHRALFLVSLVMGAAGLRAEAGKDGFQFLGRDVAPRASGMGQTAAAVADDGNAVFWNPAALGELRRREVSTAYATLAEESSLGLLSYVHPFRVGALGASVRTLRSGDIPSFGENDEPLGSFDVEDTVLSLAYGKKSGASWRWGVAVKQASEKIADVEAKALAMDAGILFLPHWGHRALPFRFAAGVRNMGSGTAFLREKTTLPQVMDFGASYAGFSQAFLLSLEAHKPRDGALRTNAGAEVWVYNAIAFRAGWEGKNGFGNGLSLGMGFKLKDVRVDYAHVDGRNGFEGSHRVGLTFRFGGAGERAYQEALALAQKGMQAEAILKFEEALDADPGHPGAARGLRESVRILEKEMATEGGDAPGR